MQISGAENLYNVQTLTKLKFVIAVKYIKMKLKGVH